MFYTLLLFLGLGIGITESLVIDNQMIIDVVDFYNVTLLTVVYEEGAEDNLDFSLCLTGVVICLGYGEQNLEAINISLEVAMHYGDLTALFFIGINNVKLLRTLNHQIFTKSVVIFMHINESDNVDRQGNLRIDNHIIFYNTSGTGDEVNMLEKYRIGFANHDNVVITRLLGTWSVAGGFSITKSLLYERRSDLFGVNLRTGVLRWVPFLDHVWDQDRKKLVGIKGYMADILSTLQSRLNFTITLSIPEDSMYGTVTCQNGSKVWNGLVGMLVHNEIDIQVTGLNWLKERDEVIDYVMPVLSDRNTLIARISQAQEVQVWAYLNIFSYDVWSTICLNLIVFSGFLFFLHFIGHEVFVAPRRREIIPLIIGAPVRQLIQIPYELNPVHLSSKISILAFAIGLYVLFAHYTCNLTANMVATPQKEDIRSLEDVSKLGYKIAVVAGTSTELILRPLAERARVDVEYLHVSKERNHSSDMSNYMKTKSNALIFTGYLSSLQIDGIHQIDIKESSSMDLSFTFQKNSPYSQLFNYHLQRMDEEGVIHRLQKKWLSKRDSRFNLDSPLSLGYNNLVFPFLTLILGCFAALLISLCERVIKSQNNFQDNDMEIDPVTLSMDITMETDQVDN